MPLDDADRQIMDLLAVDGRQPFGTIAKAVGLSEAATRQRVNRMRERGLLHIIGVPDPTLMGFGVAAMIGINADGDLRRVAEQLSAIDEAEYVVICAGGFDLLVELVCADHDALLSVVNDRVRTLEGVTATSTFVYYTIAKVNMAWGQGRLGPGTPQG